MKKSILQGRKLDQNVSKISREVFGTLSGGLRDDKSRNASGSRVAREWLKAAAVFLLIFTLGICNVWGDNYVIMDPSSETLTSGDDYLIAIHDRKAGTYTFIQSGTTKHLVQTVNNGVVSNPAAATIWRATASSTNWTFRKSGATSNGYLYNRGSNTTLSTNNSSSTTWAVSANSLSGYYYYRIQRSSATVRYVGWSGSSFAAYATSNFAVQGANSNIAQYSGALQIFKKAASATCSTDPEVSASSNSSFS